MEQHTTHCIRKVQLETPVRNKGGPVTEATSAAPQESLGPLMRVSCAVARFLLNIYISPLYLLMELLKELHGLGMKCIECDPQTAMLSDSFIHLVNVNIYGASTMWQAVV